MKTITIYHKGGSWEYYVRNCIIENRYQEYPDYQEDDVGFRFKYN